LVPGLTGLLPMGAGSDGVPAVACRTDAAVARLSPPKSPSVLPSRRRGSPEGAPRSAWTRRAGGGRGRTVETATVQIYLGHKRPIQRPGAPAWKHGSEALFDERGPQSDSRGRSTAVKGAARGRVQRSEKMMEAFLQESGGQRFSGPPTRERRSSPEPPGDEQQHRKPRAEG